MGFSDMFAKKVLLLAGAVNIVGIFIFSLGFTNTFLGELLPSVFSSFGLVSILLWGVAYIAVSDRAEELPAVLFVFAFEKALYAVSWAAWIMNPNNSLTLVFQKSALTGMFFTFYGPIDFLLGVCFAVIGLRAWKKNKQT